MKMYLNPCSELVDMIDAAIAKNKREFGYNFCPTVDCKFYSKPNYKDYICPCRDFLENVEEGHECRCGKYIKGVISNEEV